MVTRLRAWFAGVHRVGDPPVTGNSQRLLATRPCSPQRSIIVIVFVVICVAAQGLVPVGPLGHSGDVSGGHWLDDRGVRRGRWWWHLGPVAHHCLWVSPQVRHPAQQLYDPWVVPHQHGAERPKTAPERRAALGRLGPYPRHGTVDYGRRGACNPSVRFRSTNTSLPVIFSSSLTSRLLARWWARSYRTGCWSSVW